MTIWPMFVSFVGEIDKPKIGNGKNGKEELASGLSLKSYGTPPTHPYLLEGFGWDYMVQTEAQSTPEYTGITSQGGHCIVGKCTG